MGERELFALAQAGRVMNKVRRKVDYMMRRAAPAFPALREGPQLEFSSVQVPEEIVRSQAVTESGSLSPKVYRRGGCSIYLGDALDLYRHWEAPTTIISDGA